MAKLISEGLVLTFTILWYAFVAFNVNPNLAWSYGLLLILWTALFLIDTKKEIPIERRTDNRLESLLVAGISYVVLILGGTVIVQLIQQVTTGGLIKLLGTTTPALAKSKAMNFLTFGLFVAILETQSLFVRLYDYLKDKIKNTYFLIALISFIFMIFHLTAKGISNNSSLILVFIMAVISMVLVKIYKEGKQALLFHIIANSIASYFLIFGAT